MLLKQLDNLFDVSEHLTAYMTNTSNPDVSLIAGTFELLELQLKQIYKDHYKTIFNDDSLWNYYQAIVDNIEYLHSKVDHIKQLTEQDVIILYA